MKPRLSLPTVALTILLTAAVLALYLPFISSAPFFDDLNYFKIAVTLAREEFVFAPRWGPRWLIGRTFEYFGHGPEAFRVTNLAIHGLVGLAVFFFIRRLLRIVSLSATAPYAAFAGTLLFLVHPMATFAVGYIIQNTILLAMLFSVFSWHAWIHGTVSGQVRWVYASAAFYFLACFAKEQAITGMLVIVLLSIWLHRSGLTFPRDSRKRVHFIMAAALIAMVAGMVLLGRIGILFIPFEPDVTHIVDTLDVNKAWIYPISVLNQLWLYFKYVILWLVPNTSWMSLDMREPFIQELVSWRYLAAAVGFLGYLGIGAALLWHGGRSGLTGLAMLIPASMFATEVSTARIQDAFVLYRTYLWMPVPFALLLALILVKMRLRLSAPLMVIATVFFALFSANQLYTFSQNVFIWNQALASSEGKNNLLGVDRIHHNLGQAYYDLGISNKAMEHYDRAIELAPMIPYSYVNRGALLYDLKEYDKALSDFDRALDMLPSGNAFMGRALVMEAIGNQERAKQDLLAACKLKFNSACAKLKSMAMTLPINTPATKPAQSSSKMNFGL
jgi:protein O-mannosyl-transferase